MVRMAAPADHFRLQWNNFGGNLGGAFREIWQDQAFADVTLACEDGQVEAARVVLAAASPFFLSLLRRHRHPHPLLYMRGVKAVELEHILEFMHTGEVTVAQELLPSFLATAADLQVRGLMQAGEGEEKGTEEAEEIRRMMKKVEEAHELLKIGVEEEKVRKVEVQSEEVVVGVEGDGTSNGRVTQRNGRDGNSNYNEDDERDLEEQHEEEDEIVESRELNKLLLSKLERTAEGRYRCLACGKVSKHRIGSMNHCETHLNLANICKICGRVFKTRASLITHYNKVHGVKRRSLSCKIR